jgi:hypothetical protein
MTDFNTVSSSKFFTVSVAIVSLQALVRDYCVVAF